MLLAYLIDTNYEDVKYIVRYLRSIGKKCIRISTVLNACEAKEQYPNNRCLVLYKSEDRYIVGIWNHNTIRKATEGSDDDDYSSYTDVSYFKSHIDRVSYYVNASNDTVHIQRELQQISTNLNNPMDNNYKQALIEDKGTDAMVNIDYPNKRIINNEDVIKDTIDHMVEDSNITWQKDVLNCKRDLSNSKINLAGVKTEYPINTNTIYSIHVSVNALEAKLKYLYKLGVELGFADTNSLPEEYKD